MIPDDNFKFDENDRKVSKWVEKSRKHFEKRRNCSSRAISSFPQLFSKDLHCRRVKTWACLGKGSEKNIWWAILLHVMSNSSTCDEQFPLLHTDIAFYSEIFEDNENVFCEIIQISHSANKYMYLIEIIIKIYSYYNHEISRSFNSLRHNPLF